LAESGAVNSLRLPVGDWMYKPYGPYIGCTDGALDYVDLLLDWAHSYGLSVLIDIHGVKGSQNGFDNSGQTRGFEWTSFQNPVMNNDVTFEHWPIRSAGWMGTFDPESAAYTHINHENIRHTLETVDIIVKKYASHPSILGLTPVNEPWQYSPIDELKRFYWEAYLIVKRTAPYWKYIIHDAFQFDPKIWGGFMDGCPDRALDTHIYQAWNNPSSRLDFYMDACAKKFSIAEMEKEFGPVIVGEWSLATDNCAMWLNGFNDNLPGFPRLPCKYIPCPEPYMGLEQPGTPVDPGKGPQGPYGTGTSGPVFGLCPVGRDWLKESSGLKSGMDWMKAPAEAPPGRDASDEVMTQLALKMINSFSGVGHGFYFWNFRTDNDDPHWSYIRALEKGWIPKGNLNDKVLTHACDEEDAGNFLCIAKRGQLSSNIQNGISYVLSVDGEIDYANTSTNLNTTDLMALTEDEMYELADIYFDSHWQKHRTEGATCDFGGVGQLVKVNRTYSGDDLTDVTKGKRSLMSSEILIIGGIGLCVTIIFITTRCWNKGFHKKLYKKAFGGYRNRIGYSGVSSINVD